MHNPEFEFADGKGSLRWKDRAGRADSETELTRFFDSDWLRSDLAGSTLAVSGASPGAVVAKAPDANRLHARSLAFAPDGTLADATVRIECADGVEREGARSFAYETRSGRRLLVKHRTAFNEAGYSDQTTFRWADQNGLAVPVEIRRKIALGDEYDDMKLSLSAWKLEVGPKK